MQASYSREKVFHGGSGSAGEPSTTTRRVPSGGGAMEGDATSRLSDGDVRPPAHRALNAADGTRQLLISGAWTLAAGLVSGLLAAFVFGGVNRQGAHTNAGWLALIVAMMAIPFAILLLLLGGSKWLRNLGISKASGNGSVLNPYR